MPKLHKILFFLIVSFFLITRLYRISEIPPSVYWDEASIGYNAFSISKDLKDEWGEFLPLHFRAFGEFKLPVYIYSTVPFVSIFGLNEFSVRIPSVLFSLGVVLITFFLAKKITDNTSVGLWSSFFITISPWFFIFSRTGFEVTAGLMFYLLGIYFLSKLSENKWFFLVGVFSFILSVYSYNSFRLLVPLSFILLLIFEKGEFRQIFKHKLQILFVAMVLFLALIPIVRLYNLDAGVSRLQVVGENSMPQIAKNYFSHLDPKFLFIYGDQNLRHQQQGYGQIFWVELIPFLLGIYVIVKRKIKILYILPILLLLSFIPASITKESPHALRSLSAVPFIQMISGLGIAYFMEPLRTKTLASIGILTIFLLLFINYFLNFLNVYPLYTANEWLYGYKKIFTGFNFQPDTNTKILIPDNDGQPYIFALFYLQYDPQKFRNEVVRNDIDKWGHSTVKSFGPFIFGDK